MFQWKLMTRSFMLILIDRADWHKDKASSSIFFFCSQTAQLGAQADSLLKFRDLTLETHTCTHTHTHTHGRNPLNEWSACRRGRYLQNAKQIQSKLQRNSNPHSQQSSGCRPTPYMAWPLPSAHQYYRCCFLHLRLSNGKRPSGWQEVDEPWVVRGGGEALSGDRRWRSLEWWQQVEKPWVVRRGAAALIGDRKWRSFEWWQEVEKPRVVRRGGGAFSCERRWKSLVTRGFGRAYSHQH